MRIRVILGIALFVASCFVSNAQNSGSINGFIKDSASNSNLPFATVTVFNSKDTSIIGYRLSDPEGKFKVPALPFNVACRVLITYSGYRVFRYEFELTKSQPVIDLQTIKLLRDTQSLDQVIVVAEIPPVIVRNDTIEFNASSFKTLPNALVEDLLKKLPGVVISKKGEITVNGKIVNRILVDSKDFFGSDITIATKNLPANMIDKVQVIDDQEQLEQNPMIDKNQLGRAINLKLKKGFKKGAFGKIYGGIGTDTRYEAGGIMNMFRDTLQVSVLGFSNNVNKPAFEMDDIKDIGGFSRSGYSSSMMSAAGGYSLDGVSFGATGEGIQRSSGGGLNLNNDFSKKATLNLRYFYGQINNEVDQFTNNEQFLSDTILNVQSSLKQSPIDATHNFGGTYKYKIGESSSITLRSSFSLAHTRIDGLLGSNSTENYRGLLNQSTNRLINRNSIKTSSTSILFRKYFNTPAKRISANLNISTTNNLENRINEAENIFYTKPSLNSSMDQMRVTDLPFSRASLNIVYSQPIFKKNELQLSNYTAFVKYEDVIQTLKKDADSDHYKIIIPEFSNGSERKSLENTTTIQTVWHIKTLTLTPGINYKSLSIRNNFGIAGTGKQNFNYVYPGLSAYWNHVFFNYSSSVQEPGITDLQPILDNTNYLFQKHGNLDLIPSIIHSIYLTFDKYDTKRLITYRFLLSSLLYRHAIIWQRTVDTSGIQITTPVNANSNNNFRSNTSVTKQFNSHNHWNLSVTGRFYVDFNRTELLINDEQGRQNNWNLAPSLGYSLNWEDKIEVNQEYSVNVGISKYSNSFFQNQNILTHTLNSSLVCRLIKHLVLESSVDYYFTPGISAYIQKSTVIWNAALNILPFHNEKFDIRLLIYDILNQNRSVTRIIRENYILDTRLNQLTRYGMISLVYTISDFKTKKIGDREKLLLF